MIIVVIVCYHHYYATLLCFITLLCYQTVVVVVSYFLGKKGKNYWFKSIFLFKINQAPLSKSSCCGRLRLRRWPVVIIHH